MCAAANASELRDSRIARQADHGQVERQAEPFPQRVIAGRDDITMLMQNASIAGRVAQRVMVRTSQDRSVSASAVAGGSGLRD